MPMATITTRMPVTSACTTRMRTTHDGTGGYHPHESPLTMLVPLVLLSIGAIFAGFAFHQLFHRSDRGRSLLEGQHRLRRASDARDARGAAGVKLTRDGGDADRPVDRPGCAYIRDTGHSRAARRAVPHALPVSCSTNGISTSSTTCCSSDPPSRSAGCSGSGGDERTIDRFGPNGSAWLVAQGSRVTARIQSGYVYTYALVMLIGLDRGDHLGDAGDRRCDERLPHPLRRCSRSRRSRRSRASSSAPMRRAGSRCSRRWSISSLGIVPVGAVRYRRRRNGSSSSTRASVRPRSAGRSASTASR